MSDKRGNFTSKIGFILATAGSAVGLGNIWRFPYLAAKYGGGIFLLVYLALAVTFGFALSVTEIAIGRKTGLSAISAFGKLDRRFSFVGYAASLAPLTVLSYYSVIGGWVIQYIVGFLSQGSHAMAETGFFESFIGKTWVPLLFCLIFSLITAASVLSGVEKGLEKISKIMMPLLLLMTAAIVVFVLVSVDGALDGVVYYLKPDFSKLSIMTVVAAMGQLFYSMSLAMGVMVTFGSYMKKDINIVKSVKQIELFDSGVAFLMGLMIVPAVFAFSGGNESALSEGSGLMFVTMPQVFATMPMGNLVGAIFFIMVLFAAITSSISMMETVVSALIDKLKISRIKACLAVLLIVLLLSIPVSLGFGIWRSVTIFGMNFLDFFDFIGNSILMPLVAFATCLLVGYFLKPQALIDEVELNGSFRSKRFFSAMIRYIAPALILVILLSSLLTAFGTIKI